MVEALAAWSLIRLLTAIPITPGGLGIVEVGLSAALVGFGGPQRRLRRRGAALPRADLRPAGAAGNAPRPHLAPARQRVRSPAMNDHDLQTEVAELLRDLIRIDTSNPPGRETPAAMLLKDYLEANGVACELVARDPDRANLIARIPGTGEGPSLALLGHTDVVPADAEDWQHPPFDGHLDDDGYIWGRGSVDMKNETASRAVTMAALARSGFQPGGDLVFVAEADEEDGTEEVGMAWLVKARPDIAHRLRAQRGRRRAPGAGRRSRRRHGQHRREGHPRHAGHRAGRGRPRLDADVRRQRGATSGDADHPAGEPPHAAPSAARDPGDAGGAGGRVRRRRGRRDRRGRRRCIPRSPTCCRRCSARRSRPPGCAGRRRAT